MSNKVVPPIYRAVIDDVIAAIRPSFEDLGVADDVLHELQHKWEGKVIASRVADFDPPQSAPPVHHPYALALPQYGIPYVPPSTAQAQPRPGVKPEPVDPRYALAPPQYALPPLPGPSLGSLGGLAFPASLYRLPQTDGPAGSEDDDDEEDYEEATPAPRMPRTAHPSLQASASTSGKGGAAEPTDEEAINSDLDDSDTENEEDPEDAAPETDIVFCTYDKVARVKNKWKCVLKDGMIHTGGKDYLFQRCTGEFEW
ncbi:transcription factor IIA alpha/beta subunit [Mycena metata]|uniref:Transcription factor IIA alpha/beta subunit n=1 Tax=Mycena metata TaxID=1033252 RepID=A0AAD7N4W0_9AGAR|nr:transcription factor IIA alpha/beta subunit [Mycena metata]